MASGIGIAAVQAEHHESGFAIGTAEPRLSWRFASTEVKNWIQTSYELVIQRGENAESYNVASSESVLVRWPSAPLRSREIAHVRVRATGRDGSSTEWAELTIEAGLLERSDWQAELVSCPHQPVDKPHHPFRIRKAFNLGKNVKHARLYATAHGIYEVEINGKRVGDQVLSPGWQSYNHHLNYQTYDVTSLLQPGRNVVGAYVAEGWFAGTLGWGGGRRNIWGDRLGFMGQLEVDGHVQAATDSEWEYLDGPIITSGLYDGEITDSRLEDTSWSTSSWKTDAVGKVSILPSPKAQLISSDAPPVRRVREVKAVNIITTQSGKKVLDFGQNLVGWLRCERDITGTEDVVLRHAEVMENGELGTRPLRFAKATDRIILGGKIKGWEPRFTFHGFRYAEVTGADNLSLDDFTAIVIMSNLRRTGTFSCSHDMLNQLHSNVVWGMMGNFISVPTDCPQRDERLGWTGDIQVFSPTASYLFDTSGLLGGWLRDLAAETVEHRGIVPVVVPFTVGRAPMPHAIWGDVSAITPWNLYEAFGDQGILQRAFESMCLWVEEGVPKDENGMWDQTTRQFGDWLDPKAPPEFPGMGATDIYYTANAYLVRVTGLLSRIASVIGKKNESEHYDREYHRRLDFFQKEYVTPHGRIAADTQTALALALHFGLLQPAQRTHATKRLEFLIRWECFKIATGFAGTPIILQTLADNGLTHVAYRMLQERNNPSWLYPVSMGATTIWERWDSMLPDGSINPGEMTSFNHYALGSVASFLHSTVGGLSPLTPGFKRALIHPQPGGTLKNAKTAFDSVYGPFSVDWRIDGGRLKVSITVPPNAEAQVVLPGVDEVVGSGYREYDVAWKPDERWPPKGIQTPSSTELPDEFVP